MTPLDRLKLAREDYDQQEKLYNTLVLGLRFYVGIAALLGGWSLSLSKLETFEWRWDAVPIVLAGLVFWGVLLVVLYQLFQLFRGDHWTIPRTVDHYLKWEKERLEQLKSGEFETGDKSPAQFAEDEMLEQMTGAYADSACINRAANLTRQRYVTRAGKYLLVAVLALGLQGIGRMIYVQRHAKQSEQRIAKVAAPTTAPAGSGGHDESK